MFEDVGGYNDIVLVCGILFYFYCEYYMFFFIGQVYIVYYFVEGVVGLLKLVCVVDIYVKCLQMQENLMVQVILFIDDVFVLWGFVVMFEVEY